MQYFKFIILLILISFLNACSKDKIKKSQIIEKDLDLQVLEAYQEGLTSLEEGDVLFAAKKFNEAEILFPQSIWAPKSALMAAYSYYSQDYYGDAIAELDRFIKIYPYDKNLDYAYYLLATSYYEQIVNEEKDLQSLYEWYDQFPQYKYVVLINACNLFLTVETINNFIDTYLNSPNDGLFAVTNKKNYFWNSNGDLITPWPEGYELMNTKAVTPTYEGAHCLYASRLDLIGQGSFMGKAPFKKDNPEIFVIDEFESLDIDYEWQFDLYTSYWKKLNG